MHSGTTDVRLDRGVNARMLRGQLGHKTGIRPSGWKDDSHRQPSVARHHGGGSKWTQRVLESSRHNWITSQA